ncbi:MULTISPECIES: McrC family protein [Lysobacter]|uniref:McrC family protein n=1 Tax=Lysobacter TaxID=68 RepID=UPI001F23E2A8|nr:MULTISPECIES: McrC family protein [Lysobacter]UJB19969.1 McrC family protein [Lysobacter capsici]UJQ30916.1 McrC family protein [Lysobacter gummosus]
MAALVTVREYARLTTGAAAGSLDEAAVPVAVFDWLCAESERLRASGAALVQLEGRRWLRLDNYVGVIEAPCGTRIEILPKHVDGQDEQAVAAARNLLCKMLSRCLNLSPRESAATHLRTFDAPLTEWVMRQFLEGLDHLIKRGIRFDYRAVREQQRYLRGRLDVTRQLRQPPGREHLFQIEHDIFDCDRAENRLLRSALDRVCKLTGDPRNWRLSRELASYLAAVPVSADHAADFRDWREDRLMAHYRPLKPWCSLILGGHSPLAVAGAWRGLSLLFPMERVFERYVEACLRRQLPADTAVKPGASSRHLCRHRERDWFQLKPDFLLSRRDRSWVLDTKWKRLDVSRGMAGEKYGLAQSDFYQLFAYGRHYLDDRGELFLVYPKTVDFHAPLEEFVYSDSLCLRVLPFDLERDIVLGLDERLS